MNANEISVSFWLQRTADSDPANPYIVTQSFEAPAVELEEEDAAVLAHSWFVNSLTDTGFDPDAGLRHALPSGIRWYFTDFQQRIAGGVGPSTSSYQFTPPFGNISGVRSGSLAPQPLAVVYQRSVTGTTARRRRGRMFAPGLDADFDESGALASGSTARTNGVNALNELLESWIQLPDVKPILAGGDGVNRPLVSWGVGELAGVQRRRLR